MIQTFARIESDYTWRLGLNVQHFINESAVKLTLALFEGAKILGKILDHITLFHTKMFSSGKCFLCFIFILMPKLDRSSVET